MTPRQCEIAAESHAARLLAQAGYDVFVQYGPRQEHYDMVAIKHERVLLMSAKGKQEPDWPLAVKKHGQSYYQSIDNWAANQREDVVFIFVAFDGVALCDSPRTYIAKLREVVAQMKLQHKGRGRGALEERHLPQSWGFSRSRIDTI